MSIFNWSPENERGLNGITNLLTSISEFLPANLPNGGCCSYALCLSPNQVRNFAKIILNCGNVFF